MKIDEIYISSRHFGEMPGTLPAKVSMHYGKVIFLIVVNGDRHLFRELEDRLILGHGGVDFLIIKDLELHEMILKA